MTSEERLLSEVLGLRQRVSELEHAEVESQAIQAKLRDSEALLQATIESLPFDFFAIDTNGFYILQNSVCREHWGELVGKRPQDLNVGEENLRVWADNNRRALAGETVKGEVELLVHGVRGYYYNVISPIRVDGRIDGILGINVDISERKRAEDALQQAYDELEVKVRERTAALATANRNLEEKIAERRRIDSVLRDCQATSRALMDATSESMILTDREGIILDINESGARRLGGCPEDLIGKSGWYLFDGETRSERRVHVESAVKSRIPVRFQDEREGVTYDATVYPIADESGEVQRLAIFAQDITERVKAEQALRESEEQFRLVTEQSMIGVAIMLDGRIQFCNQALADMVERPLEMLLNSTIDDLKNLVHEEDREFVFERAAKILTGDSDLRERFSTRVVVGDGKTKWFEVFARPTLLRGQMSVFVTAVDVTELFRAEEALKEMNVKLNREHDLLEQKNIALKQMMQAVQEEKEKIKTQVQGNVSRLLMPLLDDLDRQVPPRLHNTLRLLRASLTEITEPFVRDLEKQFVELTPREAEICRMIRNGMQTKEIAEVLHLSERTVEKFRHSIRKKLKLGRKTNLRTHLQSLG